MVACKKIMDLFYYGVDICPRQSFPFMTRALFRPFVELQERMRGFELGARGEKFFTVLAPGMVLVTLLS